MAQEDPQRAHLLDLLPENLVEMLRELGAERYRGDQVLRWVYAQGAASFDAMTNLPKALREALKSRIEVYASHLIRRSVARDGTTKLLLRWRDGAASECVLIPSGQRSTACISTQVGCPVGCLFCASGIGGLERNLSAGQIVEQVLRVRAAATAQKKRLTHVVFMGIGEPLANYDCVLDAVRTINADWGVNIGARKITISTVGLPGRIRRLAREGLQLNLALSLHAPNDALRRELIPWAEKVSIAQLASACQHFFETTGREITLEYILLRGVNDRQMHAEQLARFARRFRSNVNLIRYNPVASLEYERPTSEQTYLFQRQLRQNGINAHVRTSRGLEVNAACGQLRLCVDGTPSADGTHRESIDPFGCDTVPT